MTSVTASGTSSNETETMASEEFAYLPAPHNVDEYKVEGFAEKFIRKTKQNPFVPIGLLATTAALSVGIWQMRTGNKQMSQLMMRSRIFAQAFTVGAILVGVVYSASDKK